jgi:dipeptidyl aminopeptidase/acylaminoacyl peptidase
VKRTWIVGAAVGLAGTLLAAQAAERRAVTTADVVTASTAKIAGEGSLQLSPDGRRVVYTRRDVFMSSNDYGYSLWVKESNGRQEATRISEVVHSKSYMSTLLPAWSPDSKVVAFLSLEHQQLSVLRIGESTPTVLVTVATLNPAVAPFEATEITSFKWSPDGRSIALVLNAHQKVQSQVGAWKGIEADDDWYPNAGPRSSGILVLLDMATKAPRRLTSQTLYLSRLSSFDWSPDSTQIALAGVTDLGRTNYMRSDIYVADVATGTVRPLVQQPGWDDRPTWSPDGKSIAFVTQMGREDWTYSRSLAVVPAAGGLIRNLTERFQHDSSGAPGTPDSPFWLRDGHSLAFTCRCAMKGQLRRIDINTLVVTRLTPDDDRWYSEFSYSAPTDTLAFTSEDPFTPADVHVGSVPISRLTPLTDLNPGQKTLLHGSYSELQWPSADNKWVVHGALIKPAGFKEGQRYPLLTIINGGPSMVWLEYGVHWQFPVEEFAARGYLVFLPNTRGRSGYGVDFEHAIRDEHSYARNPFSDVMTGVDSLIQAGLADPERLGVLGHSYGGYLAGYGLTQTKRFRAASLNEAHIADMVFTALMGAGRPDSVSLIRDLMGHASAHEPGEFDRLMAESPAHLAKSIVTPTLLEFGEDVGAPIAGRTFAQSLLAMHVPSEFIVYPQGHLWSEPQIRAESFARNLEWFDYWVMGRATDRMQRRYGTPKQRSVSERE